MATADFGLNDYSLLLSPNGQFPEFPYFTEYDILLSSKPPTQAIRNIEAGNT